MVTLYKFMPQVEFATPMHQRIYDCWNDGRIPQTQQAAKAIGALYRLRRTTRLRCVRDWITEWIDTAFEQSPNEALMARRNAVRDAKAACAKAGIPLEVIDCIFPEGPSALNAKSYGRQVDIEPEQQTRQAAEEPRRSIFQRFHLWRERQRHATHMDGTR